MEEIALKILNFQDINYNQVDNHNNSALIYACLHDMKKVALKLLEFDDINYNHISD
jgi:ankyrin repeat protein